MTTFQLILMLNTIISVSAVHLEIVFVSKLYGLTTKEAIKHDMKYFSHTLLLLFVPFANAGALWSLIYAVSKIREK